MEMTSSRKVCLYKNCEKEPGSTLFKFPLEKERFTTWCVNAGVYLHGEVDITEPRYLCEQHFSAKYINKQSRRKMLVHTAVPKKWRSDINEEHHFTVVGTPLDKKRKFPSISLADIDLKTQHTLPSPLVETVVRRSSSRLLENTSASSIEAYEDIEAQWVEEKIEETVEPPTKMTKLEVNPPGSVDNEEVSATQPSRRSKVQYIVVKPKGKPANAPRILNTIPRFYDVLSSQASPGKKMYENYEQLETESIEELGDISSTNVEICDEGKSPELTRKESKKSEELESYSEFIFNGEKYVQMPKRVFEAEKEKIRKEAERCQVLLRKLKHHLNNMDLD